MKKRDIFLIVAVTIVWGVNFTVIKIGLRSIPPLFLVFLRYLFVLFPLILFVKKPSVSWSALAGYGLCVGVGQFSLLFCSIRSGMPAGLASVVLQAQVFFTLLLSAVFLGEKIGVLQFYGLGLAAAGLGLIGEFFETGVGEIPPMAFLMCLSAAFFCGSSNVIVRKAVVDSLNSEKSVDMMGMVVWSSAFVPLPMLCISLIGDGPSAILQSLIQLNAASIFSVLYLVILSTLFGFCVWNRMIATYSAGKVAPFSFLAPITGLLSAMLLLGEEIKVSQWWGITAVIVGLAIFQFGNRASGTLMSKQPPKDQGTAT